ncbi:hypothetical protein [Bradyrhizobium brasilense]|uniref:hypothetical protein n=1 Tax=Bradyrhizobium brasilense TaxID=1419277 RepID=UPI001E45F916|nr:hypothetical protein [Bradyrhizobium brasilense]MCC8969156.1 hypothetical protein [Bradyrhizobium brasilense]
MSSWLMLPVKSLRNGKYRLASFLSDTQRRWFNSELFARSLALARGYPGVQRTLVVGRCLGCAGLAHA